MSIYASEVMATWNKPKTIKNFHGATLGYFAFVNKSEDKTAILEAIVDFTHRRFCFFPYEGSEAQIMKEAIDKTITAPNTGSFSILWTWAKDKQLSRKHLLYDTTEQPNYVICCILTQLWQLCQQYKEIYKDEKFPKLPTDWHSRLKLMEGNCKIAIKLNNKLRMEAHNV